VNRSFQGTPGYRIVSLVFDKRTWYIAQTALRLTGSFDYQNPIVQYPDSPSRENSFANREILLIGGSQIGCSTVRDIYLVHNIIEVRWSRYLRWLVRGS
jgi:hypothetical protein